MIQITVLYLVGLIVVGFIAGWIRNKSLKKWLKQF